MAVSSPIPWWSRGLWRSPDRVCARRDAEDGAVPDGAQNFWEWLVESLYEFLEGIVGSELVKKTFWFFATIFIFILFTNWFGLIPGVGTIGWGQHTSGGGFEVTRPLLRGGNADLNMTFAMAMIFLPAWIVLGVASQWRQGDFLHLFGPKGETTGVREIPHDRGVLRWWASWRCFRSVPAHFAELPSLRKHFCRRKHAGGDVAHDHASGLGQGLFASCCRCRFISWNCWWALCRRWCSCC